MQPKPHHGRYHEIELWKRAAGRISPTGGEEEQRVREQLDAYIRTLTEDLAAKPEDDSTKVLDVAELEEKVYDSSHHSTSVPSTNAHASRSVQYQIHDKPLFASSVAVLSIVVLFFFLHSWIEEYVELSLAWIAIMGAMVHLVVSGIREIDRVLEKVEFSTLIFFAALFVLMHGLEQLGVMDFIGGQVAIMIVQVQAGKARLTVAILLIIWVSAIVSAFIDNIPYTTAMIPIVTSLSETYVCDAGSVSVTSPSRRYHLVYSLSLSHMLVDVLVCHAPQSRTSIGTLAVGSDVRHMSGWQRHVDWSVGQRGGVRSRRGAGLPDLVQLLYPHRLPDHVALGAHVYHLPAHHPRSYSVVLGDARIVLVLQPRISVSANLSITQAGVWLDCFCLPCIRNVSLPLSLSLSLSNITTINDRLRVMYTKRQRRQSRTSTVVACVSGDAAERLTTVVIPRSMC